MIMNSLYIHIPFCIKKCAYCDFYSINYDKNLVENYIKVLTSQIHKIDCDFNTIYIGGGTPTILEARFMKSLLHALRKVSKKVTEFTIEANPDSITDDKIKLFLDYGVNRISIGVQSLNDVKLNKLGRLHSAKRAIDSVFLAKKNGIRNISIDLIFGVWQETIIEWKSELKGAVQLPITHISTYSLTYEKNTPISEFLKKGKIKELNDTETAAMYRYAMNFLPKNGYSQYEISNFAKKGYECKHNLSYWKNNPYVGLGAGAVSYCAGQRQKNVSDVQKYINTLERNKSVVTDREKLSPEKSARETAAIKIRTADGINREWFRKKTGFDIFKLEKKVLKCLEKQGLICYGKRGKLKDTLMLTRKGFLFCDLVSGELL